jgi:hypothetical protein
MSLSEDSAIEIAALLVAAPSAVFGLWQLYQCLQHRRSSLLHRISSSVNHFLLSTLLEK